MPFGSCQRQIGITRIRFVWVDDKYRDYVK